MNSDTRAPIAGLQPGDLTRHSASIRALLRRLVAEQDVEDLVQDTWVHALGGRLRHRGSLRSWLRGIAKNLAADHLRRRRRERLDAASTAATRSPSTECTVTELESWRELGGAVERLPEPYRTAVILRFFRGRSCAEIAAETGVSEVNARQRVRRGVAQLRARLTPASRVRLLFLLPMIPVGATRRTPGWVAATGVVAVGLLGGTAWILAGPDGRPAGPPTVGSAPTAATGAPNPTVAHGADAGRRPVPPPAEQAAAGAAGVPGIALWPDGSPAAHQPLFVWESPDNPAVDGSKPFTISDEHGSFEVRVPGRALFVGGTRAATTLRGGLFFGAPREDPLPVVLARPVRVHGRVVDAAGEPVPGTDLQLRLEPLRGISRVLTDSCPPHGGAWSVGQTSPEDGTFACVLPPGPSTRLVVRHGLQSASVVVPTADTTGLEIRLEHPFTRMTVSGRVTSAQGEPLPGARVAISGSDQETIAAADGRYELVVSGGAEGDLFAVLPGVGATVVENFTQRFWLASGSMRFRRDLVIDRPRLELRGRVVDAAGRPLPEVVVTPWNTRVIEDGRSIEDLAIGEPCCGVSSATGEFVLRGMSDRPYRLMLFDRASDARTLPPGEWRPGGYANLRFDISASRRTITGVVTDGSGRPVPGIAVSATVDLIGRGEGRPRALSAFGRTRHDGRFELDDVEIQAATLRLNHDDYLPLVVPADRPHVELVMFARSYFHATALGAQVRWLHVMPPGEPAEPVTLFAFNGGRRKQASTWPVIDGAAEVLTIRPGRFDLVLSDARRKELGRRELLVEAGRLTIVSGTDGPTAPQAR